ncbi:hypothetical protein BP5796_11307 [Coleophoma crateriformis]|uniref:C2H2-type domain-containing protein n=1 Tax=Coleophoma crateriformis TaxID=565419 RepID=A0A3D8QHY3_9HELO|nr:hypothetical protein BP5796_11307 [Coleophoma crateriformis]
MDAAERPSNASEPDSRPQGSRAKETQVTALVQEELKNKAAATSPISVQCNDCMTFYSRLSVALHDSLPHNCFDTGFDRDRAISLVKEYRAKFNGWAGSIAATQSGHLRSSLDYRLKDAVDIRKRILAILLDLRESLLTATDIVFGKIPNEKWQVGALSDSEDEEFPVDGLAMGEQTSHLQELFAAMKLSNSSLMKMSMVIRKSPGRDDYLKAATRYNFDPRWDIGHVKEKHGDSRGGSEWLLQRLGKAITRRRQYLKFRQEHYDKLSRDDEGPVAPETQTTTHSQAPRTLASTKATTFIQNEVPFVNTGQDMDMDTGSFATQTSYDVTTIGETSQDELRPPPQPQYAFPGVLFEFGEPFICPYCWTEEVVQNRAAWKKHVFQDLKPYVCTFEECDLKMFKSRREWFTHELQLHRREWTCQECSHKPFSTQAEFLGHLISSHKFHGNECHLEAYILQSEEPVNRIPTSACPLCDGLHKNNHESKDSSNLRALDDGTDDMAKPSRQYVTVKQFRSHLGRHLEQLALFALPRTEDNDMDDDSADEDADENASGSIKNDTDTDSLTKGKIGAMDESSESGSEELLLPYRSPPPPSLSNISGPIEPRKPFPPSEIHPEILTATYCREKLTVYALFSIRKQVLRDGHSGTWAKAEIIQENIADEEIAKQIKRLNDKGPSAAEKMEKLFPFQQGQVTKTLDYQSANDNNPNFEWSLAQLHCEKRRFKDSKKKETTAILVYLKRAPIEDIDPIALYQYFKSINEALANETPLPVEHLQQPPAIQSSYELDHSKKTMEELADLSLTGPTGVSTSSNSREDISFSNLCRRITHYLALRPFSESEIMTKLDGTPHQAACEALKKVADEVSGKWKLQPIYWNNLDVWNFDYDSEEDRQMAIENAVRQYDRMRINSHEPQWERLLPEEERRTGKSLSRLVANMSSDRTAEILKIDEYFRYEVRTRFDNLQNIPPDQRVSEISAIKLLLEDQVIQKLTDLTTLWSEIPLKSAMADRLLERALQLAADLDVLLSQNRGLSSDRISPTHTNESG